MIICDISCPLFLRCDYIRETYPCYYEQGVVDDMETDDDEYLDKMTY